MAMGDWGSGQYGSYGGGGELESAKAGTGGAGGAGWAGKLGYISGAMNIAKGFVKAEDMRKTASGLHDDYKELMKRANQALEQGWRMAMDIRREGADVLGEQSAAFGKSGTLMEGSPLLIEADTQRQIDVNAQRAIEQAWLDYIALRYQAKKQKKAASGMAKAADWMMGESIANVVAGVGGAGGGLGGAGGGMGFMEGSQMFGG